MAKPQTTHTIESLLARTSEVGDCFEWQDYIVNNTPMVYHAGKMIAVRKLLAILDGQDVSKITYWGSSCNNFRCVNPEHAVGRTNKQHFTRMAKAVDQNGAIRLKKLQDAARKRGLCKIDEQTAIKIMGDGLTCAESAAANGISKSRAAKIKRGTAWRQVSASVNPWGGLIR